MALPEPSSKGDGQKGKGNDQDDKDFDPSAEALIDEIDDERTLEEEEALDGGSSGAAVQEELDALKKESEMPIEELLAYYQRMQEADEGHPDSDDEEEDMEDEDDEDDDEEEEDDDEDETSEIKARSKSDSKRPGRDGDGGVSGTSKPSASGSSSSAKSVSESANKQTKSDTPSKDDSSTTGRQNSARKEALEQTNKNQHGASITENDPGSQPKTSVSSTPQPLSPKLTTSSTPNSSNTEIASSTTLNNNTSANTDALESTTLTSKSNNTTPIVSSSSNVNNENPRATPTSSDLSTNTAHELKLDSIGKRSENQDKSTSSRAKHPMTEFFLNEDEEAAGMFKTLLGYDLDDSDDLDEDYSYTDDENGDDERDWRRVIHLGPEHQAEVPEGLSFYEDHLPPYENDDRLIWKCDSDANPDQILQYLKTASLLSKRTDISISSASVPKISYETIRLYRERMQEILTSSSEVLRQENHISLGPNLPTSHKDVYMSQSRKRAKIDLELEQENTIDCINSTQLDGIIEANQGVAQEDNSDSTSQEAVKPELSTEEYFQDEEQLLFLLLQCNHNFDEALRRRRLDPFKYYLHEPMSLWSQEECLGFEDGLRIYGKNFRLIRDNKVPTRTHAEVVAFYYLWKKSERYDVYINRYKLDRQADKPVSPLISPPRPDNSSTTLYLYADTCM